VAPTLKEGELRLLTALAALTENRPFHSITISTRGLSALTKLAPSALNRAIEGLSRRVLITVRHGSTTRHSSYMILLCGTVRASFREAPCSFWRSTPR
jgi:DNA-binding MarR family transcriptional regulator